MNELKLIRNIKIKSENAELTYECYYIHTHICIRYFSTILNSLNYG